MSAYYNENEPFAAQWLRNLIAAGHIAPGDVDERSIVSVPHDDLKDYTQCHFFAGLGAWSYALRLGGWDDQRPVWTGSCPCQPFSNAGKQLGEADPRHLWPEFERLIAECRPATVFGEQVAGALGRDWLAAVRVDLESLGYAVGAADLCAAGVGAPHIRQRLWWVANANGGDASTERQQRGGQQRQQPQDGDARFLANAAPGGQREHGRASGASGYAALGDATDGVALGDAAGAGSQGQPDGGCDLHAQRPAAQRASSDAGPWSDVEWIACRDGKARPTQPGLFPLAYGATSRVGRLRSYGNAIVPQVAATFISAAMECAP